MTRILAEPSDIAFACIEMPDTGRQYLARGPSGSFVAQELPGKLVKFDLEGFIRAVTTTNGNVRGTWQSQQYSGNLSEGLAFIDQYEGTANGNIRPALQKAEQRLRSLGAKSYAEIRTETKALRAKERSIKGYHKPPAYSADRCSETIPIIPGRMAAAYRR